MANFKQGKGDYSGLAGWSNDGADITMKIRSYKPNAFGLYDMSGNVAEWVADVYRPIIDNDANDFSYFRGNVFEKKKIDEFGNVVGSGLQFCGIR
ncbi:MAG: SUMF1/EgtB/PvdO family nonheme iron enzyme [Flavobacteriaceae bacterium]|nr:SUMF1/EgtB/PvdO family nonheme iron enzyme [Flavobacteriaceae bacterium]